MKKMASLFLMLFLSGCTSIFTQNIGKGISPGDQVIDSYPPAKTVPEGNLLYSKGIQNYDFH
jgi:hypothetical protein